MTGVGLAAGVTVVLDGVDLDAFALTPENSVAFDIRADEGDTPIIDVIRGHLAAGKVVALWDCLDIMPPFAIGDAGGRFMVSDHACQISTFVTLEAALKHGLTMWEGYRRG